VAVGGPEVSDPVTAGTPLAAGAAGVVPELTSWVAGPGWLQAALRTIKPRVKHKDNRDTYLPIITNSSEYE
jgi:hypothetical protein